MQSVLSGFVSVLLLATLLYNGGLQACDEDKGGGGGGGGETTEVETKINDYRKMMLKGEVGCQPAARTMPELMVKQTLTTFSKEKTADCKYRKPRSRKYGIILGKTQGTESSPVDQWYAKKKGYKFGRYDESSWKHSSYTQMMWAGSRSVGCWTNFCAELKTGPRVLTNYNFTICTFYPRGNKKGNYPYRKA